MQLSSVVAAVFFVLVSASACHPGSPATTASVPAAAPAIAPSGAMAGGLEMPLCPLSGPPRSTLAWEGGAVAQELRGRVVRILTGEALPRASVRVEPGGYRASADSAGDFRIAGLPHGRYEVRVNYIGLLEARDSVSFGGDGLQLVAAMARPEVGLRGCTPGPWPTR